MAGPGPYDPETNTIRVMKDRCNTCIFRTVNLMQLAPGKVKEMVEKTRADPFGNIPCHDTLPYSNPPQEQKAICKGWWDGYSQEKFWSSMIEIEWWEINDSE